MKKLFIFDLDGTLVDSYQAIQKSLNFTLKKLGYKEVSYAKVKRAVGWGDELFIKSFFKEQDTKRALKLYRKHHKNSLLRYVRLKPFAKKLLYLLKKKKKIIALASNRPTLFTKAILKKLNIAKYIDFVLCADSVKKIKPHPQIIFKIIKKFKLPKKDAVVIGDMDIDLEAAKRAGIDSIFIKGGSTSLNTIRKKFGDVKVISTLEEVLKLYG
ncbi:MAG: phosphoglycolate phosphatase [Candidatus Omnitrophota bacterium]|nr:MAG: phosphoglycolate phosphatase [Candidatus Omnitrophota bacterium]RKY45795.1 MAG: phosphoglycolate phosphatase [Candidatus Omnitrophota bacterium]